MARDDDRTEDAEQGVRIQERETVLEITIDRPRRRNAINPAVAAGLASALDHLDNKDDLRVGILTGAGGAFCAGMDLAAFLEGNIPWGQGGGLERVLRDGSTKPLIAAVEGPAYAAGLELVLICDLVVASDQARFAVPEVTRGLVAGGGGMVRLPRRIPQQLALEMLLTGTPLDAERALRAGLVNRLTPAGGALAAARDLAALVSAGSPLAVAAVKRIVAEQWSWDGPRAWHEQCEVSGRMLASEDAQEGARAFLEHRVPRWQGR